MHSPWVHWGPEQSRRYLEVGLAVATEVAADTISNGIGNGQSQGARGGRNRKGVGRT